MGDCTTCKWNEDIDRQSEHGGANCQQGHFQIPGDGIKDCHCWKEKERCECRNPRLSVPNEIWDNFKLICRKCGEALNEG